MVVDGVAGGGAARGDPELAVDHGQVPVDVTATDDELLGHQAQHLYLVCGRPAG